MPVGLDSGVTPKEVVFSARSLYSLMGKECHSMQKLLVAALLLFHAGCAGSSKLSPGDGVPVKEIVSLNDIEVLVKSGVPDDVIIRRIQSGRTLFVLSDEAVLDLKSAGVSENIIACIKSKLSAYEHQAEIRSEPPPEPQSHSGLRLSEARQKS